MLCYLEPRSQWREVCLVNNCLSSKYYIKAIKASEVKPFGSTLHLKHFTKRLYLYKTTANMTKGKSKKNLVEEEAPTRTAQHCAQCTAHGQISLLKGHKKQCPFKECRCVHCVLVNNKRQIMAKQVKLKRLQEKNHSKQRRARAMLCDAMDDSRNKKSGRFSPPNSLNFVYCTS